MKTLTALAILALSACGKGAQSYSVAQAQGPTNSQSFGFPGGQSSPTPTVVETVKCSAPVSVGCFYTPSLLAECTWKVMSDGTYQIIENGGEDGSCSATGMAFNWAAPCTASPQGTRYQTGAYQFQQTDCANQ